MRGNLLFTLKWNHFCGTDSCWLAFKETELLQTPNSPWSGSAVFLPLYHLLPPSPRSFSIFLFLFVFDSLFLSWLTFPPLPYFYSLLIVPHHWDLDVMLTQFQKWEEHEAATESTLGISFVSPLAVFLWRHLIASSDCEWSTYFRRCRSRSGFKTCH